MEISEHYPEFKKNTIIIVTNNELVRIFSAHGRHIEDKKVLQLAAELQNKKSDNAKSPAPDIDEIKNQK
ncbi:hypothetical protein KJ766_03810, partial [Patescibacteria group bacterium]|nr:hypothetical protein [Patescibacteria group bacterium]